MSPAHCLDQIGSHNINLSVLLHTLPMEKKANHRNQLAISVSRLPSALVSGFLRGTPRSSVEPPPFRPGLRRPLGLGRIRERNEHREA